MSAASTVGAVLTVAVVAVSVTWRRSWSWATLTALTVVLAWPAVLWSDWLFFPFLYAVALLMIGRSLHRAHTLSLQEENRWRREDGDPPYVPSQRDRDEAYRRGRGR